MIYFIMALYCEAKPIIERYQMKKLTDVNVFQTFKGQDSLLTISGVGGINSSASAARLFTLFPPEAGDVAVNMGICGGNRKTQMGQTILCNKIMDQTNDRKFYPDILFKHPFSEGTLKSYPKIVEHAEELVRDSVEIVDMEGASFYQTAVHFFPAHQIYVLKIVSDFIEPQTVTAKKIEDVIGLCIEEVWRWLDVIDHITLEETFKFSEKESESIRQVEENLKLSVAMKIHFQKLAKNYKIRKGELLVVLECYSQLTGVRKEDRKRYYEELSGELTQ